jgi:extracellular factor (EF) 3-hydroxypalmitic acid methyl ester biosynthesis protein
MVQFGGTMNKTTNGNGNGGVHLDGTHIREMAQRKPPSRSDASATVINESRVLFHSTEGVEVHGRLVDFNRQSVAFELFGESVVLRSSEVLTEFQIQIQGQKIYYGQAVITALLDNASKIVCEVELDESQWISTPDFLSAMTQPDGVATAFKQFELEWQKLYIVSPDFKVIVADIEMFLHDLKIWLDRVEANLATLPAVKRGLVERQLALEIGKLTSPWLTTMFEKFEAVLRRVEPGSQPAHSVFARRILHPFLMGSPFLHRAFYKPLGYAGDYEMVNMLSRDPFEGKSLFAKIVNLWFWEQSPAEAHRNRLTYLAKQIEAEAYRLVRHGRRVRVFNFACGPALEIQNFLKKSPMAGHVDFLLADFNSETLEHTKRLMEEIKDRRGLRTAFYFAKKSVHQLLKDSGHLLLSGNDGEPLYDFVYCAGLFDYLSDRTCLEMMNAFYNFVAPGGLLVSTNVAASNPRIPTMDHVMAWHLIHRTVPQFAELRPGGSSPEDCTVKGDATGVNLFLEVRKPEHG